MGCARMSPKAATLSKQSFLSLLSYDAQRLYGLWIPKSLNQ